MDKSIIGIKFVKDYVFLSFAKTMGKIFIKK